MKIHSEKHKEKEGTWPVSKNSLKEQTTNAYLEWGMACVIPQEYLRQAYVL